MKIKLTKSEEMDHFSEIVILETIISGCEIFSGVLSDDSRSKRIKPNKSQQTQTKAIWFTPLKTNMKPEHAFLKYKQIYKPPSFGFHVKRLGSKPYLKYIPLYRIQYMCVCMYVCR